MHCLATVKCIYLLDCSLRLPWQHLVCSVKFLLSYGGSYASQSLGSRKFFFFCRDDQKHHLLFWMSFVRAQQSLYPGPYTSISLSRHRFCCCSGSSKLPHFPEEKEPPAPIPHPVGSCAFSLPLDCLVSWGLSVHAAPSDSNRSDSNSCSHCLPLRAGHLASFLSQIDGSVSLEEFGHAFSRYVHRCIVGIHEMAPGKAAGVVPSF